MEMLGIRLKAKSHVFLRSGSILSRNFQRAAAISQRPILPALRCRRDPPRRSKNRSRNPRPFFSFPRPADSASPRHRYRIYHHFLRQKKLRNKPRRHHRATGSPVLRISRSPSPNSWRNTKTESPAGRNPAAAQFL